MGAACTVITSINRPTKAVQLHAEIKDRRLIVVGDKKTPSEWHCAGADFIPYQRHGAYNLSKKLPFNHYCRKMIGYLRAMERGAEAIIDTDDDNVPYPGHGFPAVEGILPATESGLSYLNIYRHYTERKIWPRGFPLRCLAKDWGKEIKVDPAPCKIGIWQGLADQEPDVDAIYRLLYQENCTFLKKGPLVLAEGTICPINSQNTLFVKAAFPLLYLPAYVSFRFTDILRGYVAQPILWAAGYRAGFTDASVCQERNEHDLMRDFEEEIPVYLLVEKTVDTVKKAVSSNAGVAENLASAYKALYKAGIVPEQELELLDLWLRNFQAAPRG